MSTWQDLRIYVYIYVRLREDDIHHMGLFPGACNKLLPTEGMQLQLQQHRILSFINSRPQQSRKELQILSHMRLNWMSWSLWLKDKVYKRTVSGTLTPNIFVIVADWLANNSVILSLIYFWLFGTSVPALRYFLSLCLFFLISLSCRQCRL